MSAYILEGHFEGHLSIPSRIYQRGHIPSFGTSEHAYPAFTWRRTLATAVAAALACLMAFGVIFGHNGLTAYRQKRLEEHRLHDQMQQLQDENSRLRGHVSRLQSDPGAIEHQAREDLHYTRPGEVIYTLDPGEADGRVRSSSRP